MPERLVLPSHNRKKAAELRAILEPLGIRLLSLADFPGAPEPVEDGDTFEANALDYNELFQHISLIAITI